jgi:hypothetical protein
MKIIGSKQEQEFRRELIESHTALFKRNEEGELLNILKSTFNKMKTAYIINWTPEQGEDLYTILINVDTIAKIEISRISSDEKPIIQTYTLKDFNKGLSKVFQIKLAVAIDLAKNDISLLL